MDALATFAASLAAILGLALAAHLLRLGGGSIADAEEAMREAEGQLPGFEAAHAQLGSDGRAAIVHGRDGSVALLKLHGSQVAARRVPADAVRATDAGLLVTTGERRFGDVLVRDARG